jgi:hypothetical protein
MTVDSGGILFCTMSHEMSPERSNAIDFIFAVRSDLGHSLDDPWEQKPDVVERPRPLNVAVLSISILEKIDYLLDELKREKTTPNKPRISKLLRQITETRDQVYGAIAVHIVLASDDPATLLDAAHHLSEVVSAFDATDSSWVIEQLPKDSQDSEHPLSDESLQLRFAAIFEPIDNLKSPVQEWLRK